MRSGLMLLVYVNDVEFEDLTGKMNSIVERELLYYKKIVDLNNKQKSD